MKEEKKQATPEQVNAANKVIKFGCLPIAAILLFVVILSTCSDEPENYYEKDLRFDAYQISQDVVKLQLKSPGSAEFPFDDFQGWKLDSATYVIKGYVDSQNAYGALMRANYRVKFNFKGTDPNLHTSWDVLEFSIE